MHRRLNYKIDVLYYHAITGQILIKVIVNA